MDLYFLSTATKSAVVSAGNRKQAVRVGQVYFDDVNADGGSTVITTCVKLEVPENARVVAALATAA